MKEVLPVQLANQAQNYFVASWKQQGWDGKVWETPKRKIEGTSEWKYPKKKGLGRRTRATLVQTGALRQATANSIRSKVFGSRGIRLVVDLPYAKMHNDGGTHIVSAHAMPQRKFMGDSPILRAKQIIKIKQFTDKVWQA
jgi:phage gpG-like protein